MRFGTNNHSAKAILIPVSGLMNSSIILKLIECEYMKYILECSTKFYSVLRLDDSYKNLADIDTPTCRSTVLEEMCPSQGLNIFEVDLLLQLLFQVLKNLLCKSTLPELRVKAIHLHCLRSALFLPPAKLQNRLRSCHLHCLRSAQFLPPAKLQKRWRPCHLPFFKPAQFPPATIRSK